MKENGNGNRWLMLFAGTVMLLFLGLIMRGPYSMRRLKVFMILGQYPSYP